MNILTPATNIIEKEDFPYSGHGWGYDLRTGSRQFLDSLLYTIDDPGTPDGMAYVMDISGMAEWYDRVADTEEREQYNCPTVYEYIAFEIGRFVTPLSKVTIPAVFINCRMHPFIQQIFDHEKLIETRSRNTLGRLAGQDVLLVETGNGQPVVRGFTRLGPVVTCHTRSAWNTVRASACIPYGSDYDWKPDTKKKVLYYLNNTARIDPFELPATCRRHGRVWAEYVMEV